MNKEADAISGLTGTVTIDENADLTLNGTNATSATITGAGDVNVNADLTLNKATDAISGLTGTVTIADDVELTLNGTNTTAAEFVGGDSAVINVNANNTFTADNTDFVGTVNVAENKALTLKGDFSQDEKGTIVFAKGGDLVLEGDEADEVITIGAKLDNSAVASGFLNSIVTVKTDAELTAEGAVDNFKGKVDIAEDATLTLSGTNTTSMNVEGNGTLELKDGADVELTLRNDRIVSGAPAGNSLMNFSGTLALNDNTATIATYTITNAVAVTGTSDAELNITKFTNDELGKDYRGSLTLNKEAALDNYYGSVNLTTADLVLKKANDTYAVFTGNSESTLNVQGNLTLESATALNGFEGTAKLGANTLTLNGANETAATVTGTGKINANANQEFTGDVTGFTGEYVIASGNSVTLSGTFADTENSVVNASGATLNLADKSVAVTVNGGTGLNTLNFGNNSLTLGSGDFTNVNGTGSVIFADAHDDNEFDKLVAGNVTLAGGRDITATEYDGDLYINISVADNNIADLTTNSTFGDTIYVTITDQALLTGNDYKLVQAGGYAINTIQLWDNALGSYVTLTLNDGVKANGFTYTLRESADKTWILDQLAGFSNFVVVNAAWAGKVPYQQVMDGTVDRSFGFDAASDLAGAVEYIRGWNVGQGWDNGNLQLGDAKIELVAGKYSLSSGTLMTAANEVTQLTLSGRDGEVATLSGVLHGSDGSTQTTLTIENIRFQTTEVYGGGTLVINNDADDKAAGNVIAGGIGNRVANSEVTMANDSALVINGGYYNTRILVGGSVANASGSKVTVDGNSAVVIDNNSGETLTITSNIYGGSWAAVGEVVQNGDASITINADEALNIRGNIYVSGGASANGTLTMNGNSTITFTGDANNLTFTGSVNAIQSAKDEIAVFDDFNGKFNGFLDGFDSITISGSTSLEFSRRQTGTAETGLVFSVDSDSVANQAMYTVRDPNNWEFAKNINVVTGNNLTAGTYVLVDKYAGGFDDFTITLNGVATQNAIIGNYSYTVAESSTSGKLYLQVKDITNGLSTGAGVTNLNDVTIGSGSGNALSFGLGSTEVVTSGVTTINGNVNAPYSQGEVFTVAAGKTTVNGDFNLSYGDDKLAIQTNAEMEITGSFTLGNGNNDVVIGAGAELTVNGDTNLGGGNAKNIVTLEKGAVLNVNSFSTGTTGSGSALVMDVDAILNNANGYGNKPIIAVKNVASLTTDVAGAKVIVNTLDYSASANTTRNYSIDDVEAVLGTATQIAGTATAADTTDDVWASLNKVDNSLVVAWGRTSEEAGAALEAFKADSTLTIGDALVADATSLADGAQVADFDEKKSNGTLA